MRPSLPRKRCAVDHIAGQIFSPKFAFQRRRLALNQERKKR
jgi:hypothetical protein